MGGSNERLRLAREKAGFTSARSAAVRYGWVISTYASHENGQTPVPPAAAEEYARKFRTSAAWILTGESADPVQSSTVPVMGRVGAGATIEPDFDQVPPEGLFEVDLPFPMPAEMIGLEVDGESMLPKYEPGDVIVVWKDQRRGTDSFIGELAAVRTEDGRRFLKTIMPSHKRGLYRLESFNAKPIDGVQIAWVGEIYVIVPVRQVRQIGRARRAASTRKSQARERATTGMKRLV